MPENMFLGAHFDLPDDWEPEGYACVKVTIPDDPQYLAMIAGLIDSLRYSSAFARDDTKTGAATVARTWQRALEQAPIIFTGCEELMIRQSPTEPCTLEQSADGGETWEPWANLRLCPPLVSLSPEPGGDVLWFNPTGGPEETGAWEPIPVPEGYDPATDDPLIPYPADWVPEGESGACLAADNTIAAFQSVLERVDYGLFVGNIVTVVFTEVAIWVYGVKVLGKKLVELLRVIANISNGFEYAVWHPDYEAFDWTAFRDILACRYDDTGVMSAADHAGLLLELEPKSGPVWTLIKAIVSFVGPVGMTNSAKFAGIQHAEDCPDCSAGWLHTWNATDGWDGWDTDGSNPNYGYLEDGVWKPATTDGVDALVLNSPPLASDTVITQVIYHWRFTGGDPPYGQHRIRYTNESTGWTDVAAFDTIQEGTAPDAWFQLVYTQNIQQEQFDFEAPTGYCTLELVGVAFFGEGTDPYL